MLPRATNFIVAFIATSILFAFIIGLAYSISTGFAGFWGGLPFWIISLVVLAMAAYNFWEDGVKKK